MSRPLFFSDIVRKLLLGILSSFILVIFWVGAVVFLLLNIVLDWHKLWRWFAVWNLVAIRFVMRMRNLHDTNRLPKIEKEGDARTMPWDPHYLQERTASGTHNDLEDPKMGSANTRFGRNFSFKVLKVDSRTLMEPNPRDISRDLLTRDRFRPATSLNLLAAAWIQFQVHGWVNHRRRKDFKDTVRVPLDKSKDPWPSPIEGRMEIRRTEPDPTRPEDSTDPPTFLNSESHWWDGSQLYGTNAERQQLLRSFLNGELRLENSRLPQEVDDDLPGVDLTGFNDNWWVGLSLFHTLFALEHNAICASLKKAYPIWDDERLFQTARLINTALMAKIHTVEWTPAILGHPALQIGMQANWWGMLTERLVKLFGRIKILRGIQEEITGIPGSETDHHSVPYALTEEFVSVYRMHPLIPDDFRFYSSDNDELLDEAVFTNVQGNHTRPLMDRIRFQDLCYSFGVSHPGALTLNNFPRALQQFTRIKEGEIRNELLDLGTIDIVRDRERAIPRYNQFRTQLLLFPAYSYRRLVGLPLITWFSGLTKREILERKAWIDALNEYYPNKKLLDPMIGMYAENPPKGFGFSDTAFRIFILMASRRLKSDRFFTNDYNTTNYTELGIQWIDDNGLQSVLQRHFPSLSASIKNVANPFAPWKRMEQPSPIPLAEEQVTIALAPIFAGAITGFIIGSFVALFREASSVSSFVSAFVSPTAVSGAKYGTGIGASCVMLFRLLSDWISGEWSFGGKVSLIGLGAGLAWFVGILSTGIHSPIPIIGGLVFAMMIGICLFLQQFDTQVCSDQNARKTIVRRFFWGVFGLLLGGFFVWFGGGMVKLLVAVMTAAEFRFEFTTYVKFTAVLAAVGLVFGFVDRGSLGALRGTLVGAVIGTVLYFFYNLAISDVLSLTLLLEEMSKMISSDGLWLIIIGAFLVVCLMVFNHRVRWSIRRFVWDAWAWAKFVMNKKLDIKEPPPTNDRLKTVPLNDVIKSIPIRKIPVAEQIPDDEGSGLCSYVKRFVHRSQVWFYSVFSPMQPGGFLQPPLPPVASDPYDALDYAYTCLHRTKFDPPDLPPEYEGSPDLGTLAVRSPYACYTKEFENGVYEWDFLSLLKFGVHDGLYPVGARVVFRIQKDKPRLQACEIESTLGVARPGDTKWQLSKKLALCAATTHMSLVRHFNWIHLAAAAHLAIATRNELSATHPICRLLWPHIYGTQQSNYMVTLAQMVKGGDFETIFSFTYDEMCHLFEDTYGEYQFVVNDPETDGQRRGILDRGIPTPSQHNLVDLFDVMHLHAKRYVLVYYHNDGSIEVDTTMKIWLEAQSLNPASPKRTLTEDREVTTWLSRLNTAIPSLPVSGESVTLAQLARLIASCIYLVSVEHEMVGSFVWNYQLWTHRQPVRVYQNGQREPLDVYQRLINANYNLNVSRRELMDDFSSLGLDDSGRAAFTQFRKDLKNLNTRMKQEPWAVWKILPELLDVNINA